MIAGSDVFLDANILIYAARGRLDAPEKYAVAKRIVMEEDYCTSSQVLAEFYVNSTRQSAEALSDAEAKVWVETIAMKPCQPVDDKLIMRAIDISQKFQTSYWGGAIIAAAEKLGAKTLYTEDLNHGQSYGSVRAINPFKPHPDFQ